MYPQCSIANLAGKQAYMARHFSLPEKLASSMYHYPPWIAIYGDSDTTLCTPWSRSWKPLQRLICELADLNVTQSLHPSLHTIKPAEGMVLHSSSQPPFCCTSVVQELSRSRPRLEPLMAATGTSFTDTIIQFKQLSRMPTCLPRRLLS
jgi:hypothetical protein